MSTEEKQVEVFGTREVSVKEFMGSSDKSLVLLSDYEKSKLLLQELKDKYQTRVDELVSVDKLSAAELKELNGIRAEIREPRYLIQKIEKNNVSVFESYKKNDRAKLKELIDINLDLEEKASEKIKAEDDRKKLEKEAEAKAEEERIEKIKIGISNIETYCYEVIQKMTFDNLSVSSEVINSSLNTDFDFEEYYILFDQVKDRVSTMLSEKVKDLTDRENQRLQNEAMKKEIFEVRVNRLKEVGFELNDIGFFRSIELSMIYSKEDVLNSDSATFEKTLSDIKLRKEQVEQAKRDAELKKQKDEQFEVRKNRLAEIGIVQVETWFQNETQDTMANYDLVYDYDIVEFEDFVKEAKHAITIGNEIREQEKQKSKEAEALALKQKEESEKKAIADKKKADAENKARVKRLASDKKVIAEFIESIDFRNAIPELENEELQEFLDKIVTYTNKSKEHLLTQLNEL